MATSSNSKSNTPVIAVIIVAIVGLLIYFFTRGGNTGAGNRGEGPKPAPLPQGKAAEMARNPGKAMVLSTPRVTKLPPNNDLGAKKEGWMAEVVYTWKDQIDARMRFRAPYRLPDGRGSYAIPAKGTAGVSSQVTPITESGTKTGKAAKDAPASAEKSPDTPTFQLPQRSGKARLLLPSTQAMKLKKGDKITLSLQIEADGWQIPASNEITLPPLP